MPVLANARVSMQKDLLLHLCLAVSALLGRCMQKNADRYKLLWPYYSSLFAEADAESLAALSAAMNALYMTQLCSDS